MTVANRSLFSFLLILSTSLHAQPTVTASVGTFSRPMPLIGFNTNAHHSVANWTIPAFVESTAVLHPAVLRFPGGTVANHWDWRAGWFTNDSTTPAQFANISPKGMIRAQEFKPAVVRTGAEAIYVINFQHSSLGYQMDGLRYIDSLGLPVKYVEIGNEHNLAISNQFIDPTVYADGVKLWADSIKSAFPDSKICLVGGAPPATGGWHDSIFARSPDIDALAFHVYLGAGNTDTVFNARRALAVPFAQLNQRFIQSKFPAVPDSVEVWVTEFNMSEALAGQPYQHAETWTHGLYVLSMIHIFLENPRITMIVNHNLTNQLEFAAISPFDFTIRANGVVMQLLGEVSAGRTQADRLTFSGVDSVDDAGGRYPALIGWKFSGDGGVTGLIANLSPDTLQVDASQVFGAGFRYDGYSEDVDLTVIGTGSMTTSTGDANIPFVVHPFSVVQLREDATTGVSGGSPTPQYSDLIGNYPNPFNAETKITYRLQNAELVKVSVFDILGREVAVLVHEEQSRGEHAATWNAGTSATGIYLYRLTAGAYSETKKMILGR